MSAYVHKNNYQFYPTPSKPNPTFSTNPTPSKPSQPTTRHPTPQLGEEIYPLQLASCNLGLMESVDTKQVRPSERLAEHRDEVLDLMKILGCDVDLAERNEG